MMRIRVASMLLVALTVAVSGAIALASDQGDWWGGRLARHQATGKTPTYDRGSATTAGETPAPPWVQSAKQAPDADTPPALRFATITVTIDPKGAPLAAYQFEIEAGHAFTVVGLDHAGHPAFADPPRYDRAAAADGTDRLIIADYATLAAGQLVAKPQRVAVIHAAFTLDAGDDAGQLADGIALTLTAAADPAGNRIDADITYDLHLAERPGQE